MSLFEGSIAGDRDDDSRTPRTLMLAAGALLACVLLWALVGGSPLTRFLLAAPLVGLTVILASTGIKQARPEDDILELAPARVSGMSANGRWNAAVFRHDELARDYLPYDEDRSLRDRFPRMQDTQLPEVSRFRESVRRAAMLRTAVYPGQVMAERYVEAVRVLAHDWEVARRAVQR